jgi:hypothetical protein
MAERAFNKTNSKRWRDPGNVCNGGRKTPIVL